MITKAASGTGIVILKAVRPATAILTKKLRRTSAGWQVFGGYGKATYFTAAEHPVACLTELAAALTAASSDPQCCAVRGAIRPGFAAAASSPGGVRRRVHARVDEPAAFVACARSWVACDLDSFDLPEFVDPVRDTEHVIDAALGQLPSAFADASFYWQLTSGHGIKPGGRVRLWFWLSRPTTDRELKAWLAGIKVDVSVFAPVQPIYTAAPMLPAHVSDFLTARSGVRSGWADEVEVPSPEALAGPYAGQRAGGSDGAGFIADGVDDALDRMGDPPAYPNGLGFHAPIKAAFNAAVRVGGRDLDQAALLAAIDTALDERGHTRAGDYIAGRKRDARSWLRWFVDRAAEQDAVAPTNPHYRRPHLSGDAASQRLRRVVAAFLDRLERYLEARDWIMAETERTQPDVQRDLEVRRAAKLIARGERSNDTVEAAAASAHRTAAGIAKRRARRRAVVLFGERAVKGIMPKLQIKGAAGLGKTRAVIDEYLCRPALWKYNIGFYTKTSKLADDLAADFAEAIRAADSVAPFGGDRPRIRVIRGRQSEGMCHPDRLKVIQAADRAGVTSIYRAACHSPAVGSTPASSCPFHAGCKYIDQFDTEPGLRIMPHARLVLNQPEEIRLLVPDLVIVDEGIAGTMITEAVVDPGILTDHATYACEAGEEHLIQEAMDVGTAVLTALDAGNGGAVARLRTAGVKAEYLRFAADAARLAADDAAPRLRPGMDPKEAKARCEEQVKHLGRSVAALLGQLARDLDGNRDTSTGVEWEAEATAVLDDGSRVLHPMIRSHGVKAPVGMPNNTALLLLDADAELEINQRLFGAEIRGFTIPAVRCAHVIQVRDATLATSSLTFSNKNSDDVRLRDRIGLLVQREVGANRKVLVICAKTVRPALTGENDLDLAPAGRWQGADITHFGRHLGANDWKNHDTVIVVGRLELTALVAERQARAIWANAADVTLGLAGAWGTELRRHDLRHGVAPAVSVRVHPDRRVQGLIEIMRENAMGQGIDRLRLIHRDRPARVLVLSNLPVPGVVVDEMVTLDDMLEGGTIWQRAMDRMTAGVLPLSPAWLVANLGDLFTSKRMAERQVQKSKPPFPNKYLYWEVAVYKLRGQFNLSRALVRSDVADPKAELERLLGCELVEFRLVNAPPPGPADQPPAPEADAAPPAPIPPPRTPGEAVGALPSMVSDDTVLMVQGGGYGPLLTPGALFPVFGGQVPCDGFRVACRRITAPCDYIPRSTFHLLSEGAQL